MKTYCVYMVCSKRNGTLYLGITSDLIRRVYEHRNGMEDGFTKTHCVHCLVWYETQETPDA